MSYWILGVVLSMNTQPFPYFLSEFTHTSCTIVVVVFTLLFPEKISTQLADRHVLPSAVKLLGHEDSSWRRAHSPSSLLAATGRSIILQAQAGSSLRVRGSVQYSGSPWWTHTQWAPTSQINSSTRHSSVHLSSAHSTTSHPIVTIRLPMADPTLFL